MATLIVGRRSPLVTIGHGVLLDDSFAGMDRPVAGFVDSLGKSFAGRGAEGEVDLIDDVVD
jgi:hypothetical protein